MPAHSINLNPDVTAFLDELNHPFRAEIEALRIAILGAGAGLTENIKWNGPNYGVGQHDRITMRIQPPKGQAQLIFHRGVKVLEQPAAKLIQDDSGLLVWKEHDRAVATFKSMEDIVRARPALRGIVQAWMEATTE